MLGLSLSLSLGPQECEVLDAISTVPTLVIVSHFKSHMTCRSLKDAHLVKGEISMMLPFL